MDPDLTVPPTYWRALALTGQNRIAADLRTGNSKHSAVSLYCRRPTPESGQVPGLCTGSESGSAVYCAASANASPGNRIALSLCAGRESRNMVSLCCFSLRPAAKPDSARLMPRQRAAQYSFTAPLFPDALPVFSLPGTAIHQQSVIYGIFYTESRFSRAGCWSIWA